MAAKFPIISARQELGFTPTRAVRADIDVRTGDVGAAIGQGAVQLARQAIQIERKRQEKVDVIARIEAESIITAEEIKHAGFKKDTADTNLWQQNLDSGFSSARTLISNIDMSDDARALVETKLKARQKTASAITFVDGARRDTNEAKLKADRHYLEAVRDNKLIPEATELWRTAYSGTVGEEEQRKIFKTLSKSGLKLRREKVIGIMTGAAFGAWQSTISPENPDGDLNVGFALIEASDIPPEDKQEAESELKTRVTNRRAENKIQLEAAQEKSRDGINKALFESKDYDAANALIESSFLSETEQKTLLTLSSQRATAAAIGVPLKNDRVVESEMYDLSLGIWKGNITKKDFDAELLKVTDKLDDTAWNRLTASASNTLKTSQAESLTRASIAAKNVLVDFKSEDAFARFISDSIKGLKPDVAKAFEDNAVERRQLQFNSLTQYENETREWIAENPDKVGKDFFQFSETLKHVYWNRNIDDLRILREGIVGPPAPQGGTVTMTSPDGRTFTVPVDKKQKFLDNGFTE